MKEEVRKLQERKKKLLEAIEFTKQKKKQIVEIVQKLVSQLNSRRITRQEYEEELKQALKNRTAEQWIKYYDDYIDYYNYQIKLCDKLIKEEKYRRIKQIVKEKAVPALKISIVIVAIALMFSLIFILKPVGMSVFNKIGEKVSTTINQLTEKAPEVSEAPDVIPISEFVEPKVPVVLDDKQVSIKEESLTQYQAVVGKPVKWKKKFTIESVTGFSVELPKGSENIQINEIKDGEKKEVTEFADISKKRKFFIFGEKAVEIEIKEEAIAGITGKAVEDNENNEQEQEFEVIYETPAPEIEVSQEAGRTNIKITGPEDVHYQNILSFAEIPETLKIGEEYKLKLYQTKQDGIESKKQIPITLYDTDENGLYDKVEWITLGLSDWEGYLIIEISKAEHLDENKSFVSDIYEQVRELDDVWSETINENEYVRVTFSQLLDKNKDITIYSRVVSGNPKIEVYEIDGSEKIAEFTSLINNTYNKIYLTNLEGCYDNETEILTEKGWKLFIELENERVITLNSETGKVEWQLPSEKQVFDYNKDMYKIELEDGSNLLVSEKHRVYVNVGENDYSNPNSFDKFSVENISISDCCLNASSSDQIGVLFNANDKAKYGSSSVPLRCGDILLASERNLEYLDFSNVLTDFFNNENKKSNSDSSISENLIILSLFSDNSFNAKSGEISSHSAFNNSSIKYLLTDFDLKNENKIDASTINDLGSIFDYNLCFLATSLFTSFASSETCSSVNLLLDNISSAIENSNLLTNCLTTLAKANSNLSLSSPGTSTLIQTSAMEEFNEEAYLNFSEFDLQPITKAYEQLKQGKKLYFLDENNKPVKIKEITKQPYKGKIYDVDVENDIVLVRRKNENKKNTESNNSLDNYNRLTNNQPYYNSDSYSKISVGDSNGGNKLINNNSDDYNKLDINNNKNNIINNSDNNGNLVNRSLNEEGDDEFGTPVWSGNSNSQDKFDLRVVGGSLEIDHIIDPIIVIEDVSKDTLLINVTAEVNFTHLNISTSAPYDSLIGYWNFDGDKENTPLTKHYDWTKYNNDGTGVGNVTVNNTNCIYGDCANFDGDGDYISFSSTDIGKNHSLSMWIYLPVNGPTGNGFQTIHGILWNNGGYMFNPRYISGTTYRVYYSSAVGTYAYKDIVGLFNIGAWTHIVVSRIDTKIAIYKNRVNIGNITLPNNNGGIVFDKISTSINAINGSIDEVMVFNTSLTSAQILAIYNNQSSRFVEQGKQVFSNQSKFNISQGYNQVQVTGDYEALFGSSINLSLGYYNNSWSYTTPQVYTGSNIFTINTKSTNLTLNFTFFAGNSTNPFYSPLLSSVDYQMTVSIEDGVAPDINFTYPTPSGEQENNNIFVNVSASDVDKGNSNISTFIDFDKSLVGWWRMDEVNGNTVYDNSSYGNNGTAVGNATQTDLGYFGKGFRFNSGVGGINISNSNSLNISRDITLSAWVKLAGYNTGGIAENEWPKIVIKPHTSYGTPWELYSLSLNKYGNTSMFFISNGSGQKYSSSNLLLELNNWYHLVGIFNGSSTSLYINGKIEDSDILPPGYFIATNNMPVFIGSRDFVRNNFNGTIDDVMIFKRALSDKEIQALYANQTSRYLGVNFTNLAEGGYKFKAYAQDTAGNVNMTERTVIIAGDTIFPLINFTAPTPSPNEITTNTSIEINVSIIEVNLDEVKFNWNGTNYTIFDNSTVLFMNFDNRSALGESDTKVVDVSGYGNNGIVYGAKSNMTGGKYNGAFEFNGVDDYIIKSNFDYNVLKQGHESANWTLGAWVKPNGTQSGNERIIVGRMGCHGGIYAYPNDFRFAIKTDYCWTNSKTITYTPPNMNSWYYLVAVYNNTKMSFYANGNLVDTALFDATMYDYSNDLLIGARTSGTDRYAFNGTIDEVRIWNRSLSAEEIQQSYFSNLYKYDTDKWYLYVNQNYGEPFGSATYKYQAFAKDKAGNENMTEIRKITIIENTNVIGCRELSQPNTVYTQTKDIIQKGYKDCIIITAQNITFNGNGYFIISDNSDVSGIYSNQYNTTIKNCNISMYYSDGIGIKLIGANNSYIHNNTLNKGQVFGQLYGLYLSNTYNTRIENNTANGNDNYGIYLQSSSNNTLTGNTANGNDDYGIYLQSSSNNTLTGNKVNENDEIGIYLYNSNNNNVTGNTVNSNWQYGIYIYDSSNNIFMNNNIWDCSSGGNYACIYLFEANYNVFDSNKINKSSNYGIYLKAESSYGPFHNVFKNTNMTNIEGIDVYLHNFGGYGGSLVNNTFLNFSYDREVVESYSELIRKWYYQAKVNDSKGNVVANANVSFYNKNNYLVEGVKTNSSGWINRTEIIDYVNYGGVRTDYSPYTITAVNASSVGFHRNYNVSFVTNNLNDVITIDVEEPDIEFEDGTSTSITGGDNIFVNVSASDVNKGNSNISTFIDFDNSLVLWMRMDDVNASGDPVDISGHCYDNETEILTENGWKYFADLNKNEKVATLNQETKEAEWQMPTEKQVFDYNKDMYKIELEDGSNLLVSEKHRVYVKKESSSKNSESLSVLNTGTSDCSLKWPSLDQIGILSSNASAKKGTSSLCEINLSALSSKEGRGFLNSMISGSKEIFSNNFSSDTLAFEQTSLEYLCNSLMSLAGANSSNLCCCNNLFVKESDLNKENIILVSTTNFIYFPLDSDIDFFNSFPSLMQSSSVSSDFSKSFSNFSNTSSCFILLANASLANADQLSHSNLSIFCLNFSGTDNVIDTILSLNMYNMCNNVYHIFKPFGQRDLTNFKLEGISDIYSYIEQGKLKADELVFLDEQGREIRVEEITKEGYNGKIYDVDVENDIVLVRRKNSTAIWSGNSNNGSKKGNATQTDAGALGKGFEFDGAGDYVGISSAVLSATPFTFNCWFKTGNTFKSLDEVLVSISDKDSWGGPSIQLIYHSGEYNNAYLKFGTASTTFFSPTTNTWYMATGVCNATNCSVYLNADSKIGTGSNHSSLTGVDYTSIGAWRNAGGGAGNPFINGTIDEVMIFNRALSDEEIAALYTNQTSRYLGVNFTNLEEGSYKFKAYAQDTAGNVNFTEERTVTYSTINVWNCSSAQKFNNASCWSLGMVPVAGHTVIFNGTGKGSCNITNNTMPQNLKSFTVENSYPGTIYFLPLFAKGDWTGRNDGTQLWNVTNNINISSGTMKIYGDYRHVDFTGKVGNITAEGHGQEWRSVNGNITIGENAELDGVGLGFFALNAASGPCSPIQYGIGSCHGGGTACGLSNIYGSLTSPTSLGSSGGKNYIGAGGSAIKLDAEKIVIDGDINMYSNDGDYDEGAGSGGSIWLKAQTISGQGTLNVRGEDVPSNTNRGASSAGRIALTASDYINLNGTIIAIGGHEYFKNTGVVNCHGSGGTVYINASNKIITSMNITTTGYDGGNITFKDHFLNLSGVYNATGTRYDASIILNYTNCSSNFSNAIFDPYPMILQTDCQVAPKIIWVQNIGSVGPFTGGVRDINFTFTAYDANGFDNLNYSTAKANFSKIGYEYSRQNLSCIRINNFNLFYANYSCTVGMLYFDEGGDWNINVSIEDNSKLLGINDSTSFHYEDLYALGDSSYLLDWGTLHPGDKNQSVISNNPIIANNTGNVDFESIKINATNLFNETFFIGVSNFSVNTSDGKGSGDLLINNQFVIITNSSLPSKNSSSSGEINLYFYIRQVPYGLPSKDYQTIIPWDITFSLAVFNIRKKKKKIKIPLNIFSLEISPAEALCKYLKESLGLRFNEIAELLNRDKSTIFINYKNAVEKIKEKIVVDKVKMFVSVNIFSDRRLSVLESIVNCLRKQGFRNSEIANILNKNQRIISTLYSRAKRKLKRKLIEKKEIEVPVKIFKYGGSGVLYKYLRENIGLGFNEIARLTNREDSTVWMNYKNVNQRIKKIKEEDEITISVKAFTNRKLSVLEVIINYLKKRGMRNCEIANMLNKDQRIIGTLYSRINKKVR